MPGAEACDRLVRYGPNPILWRRRVAPARDGSGYVYVGGRCGLAMWARDLNRALVDVESFYPLSERRIARGGPEAKSGG